MKFKEVFTINEKASMKKIVSAFDKQGMTIKPAGYGPKDMYYNYEFTPGTHKDNVKAMQDVEDVLISAGLEKYSLKVNKDLNSGTGDFSTRVVPDKGLVIIDFKK